MTLLQYIQSLQDQGLSQQEIWDKAEIWKKNNPQPEVEEVTEIEGTDTEYQAPGLSSVNVPGTLGWYENRMDILKMDIDKQAETLSDPINDEVTTEDVAATLQVGGREYSFEQIQYQIDNKAKGFEDIATIQEYIDKMGGAAKINYHIRPGLKGTYSGVYNPLEEVEVTQPFGYEKEDIDEVLGHHIWFDPQAHQPYNPGGYQAEAHNLLGEYWGKLYGDGTPMGKMAWESKTGRESGISTQMEDGGIVGYADVEYKSGGLFDFGGTTSMKEKYGRDDFLNQDRLVTFDLTGEKNQKLASYYSQEDTPDSDNRMTFINVPAQQQFRLQQLNQQSRNNFDFTNEELLGFGDFMFSEDELELRKLQVEYDSMPDEVDGAPNDKKLELGKKIDSIAGDDYGNKLYDPSTGTLIDVKAKDAPLPAIELFNEAEKISGTDIDTLTNGLTNTYHNLRGLAMDVLKTDEWLKEKEYNWTQGSDAMLWSNIGNNQQLITRPENITDSQLELLKEFAETGVIPEGLSYIPGEHPVATAFNDEFNNYTVTNTAINLNRNLATREKGYGGQEFLEGLLDVGGNIFGGDISGDNYLTSFEQAVAFKDFLEPNFDIDTEAINIATVKNFGQRNFGALPHFGEFLLQMYINPITARSGSLVQLGNWTKKFAGGYKVFKNNPFEYKMFKGFTDAMVSGLQFETTSAIFDEQYQPGQSFLFGSTMKGGEIAAHLLGKGFFTSLTNSILSPKSQFLANNAYYRGLTKPIAYGRNLKTPRKIINRGTSAALGGGGFTFANVVTDPQGYFDKLEEDNISAAEAYVDEVFKMVIMGGVTKGLPGVTNIKNAVMSDVVRIRSKGKSSPYTQKAIKFFGLDKDIIENPTEDSYTLITDATKEKVEDLLKRKREGKISKEDAEKEFKEIKKNQRAANTQIGINTAYTAIQKERERGNLTPSDGQVSVIANKIKEGKDLTASEAEMLDNIPKEVLYDYLGIQAGTSQANALEAIYGTNRIIMNQLNGGGPNILYTGIGPNAKIIPFGLEDPMGIYAVSNQLSPKLFQETYNFLKGKMKLNAEIEALENRDTKNLSETEKLKLKNELALKKEQAEEYLEEGEIYKNIQSKLLAESNKLLEERTEWGDNLKGGRSKILDDVQSFQDRYDASGLPAKSVKGEIAFIDPNTGESFINREVANKIKDFTAGTHEDVHKIFIDMFKGADGKITDEGIEIIDDVLNRLSPAQRKLVDNEISGLFTQRYDTSKPKNEWYEENLTVLSELIDKGRIKFSEELGESLQNMFPIFKKKLPNLDPEKVTGKDIFNLFKKLSTNREEFYEQAEQLARDAAKLKGEEVPVLTDAQFSAVAKNLNPLGIEMFEASKGKYNKNEIINDFYENNPKLQEQFMSVAADALGFRVDKGTKTQQEFEDFVIKYKMGILRRFDPKIVDGKPTRNLTNFIYNNLKPKRQKFYETIEREGITGSIEEMRERGQEVSEIAEEVEVRTDDDAGLAKKPSETVVYKTEALENLGLKPVEGKTDAEVINEEIARISEEAFEGKDIKRFKETANLPENILKFYGDMFGLTNIEPLKLKKRNFQKYDEKALVRARQFLIDNAASDFARLPRTKDDFGKATGIYQTKLGKALYDADGKLIGTLKDYMDIIKGKNVTVNGIEFNSLGKDGKPLPIYRDSQHYKTALDMHMRNTVLEAVQDVQGERIRGGAKFSKPMEMVDVEKVSEIVPDAEINIPGGALSASRKRRTFQDKFNEILSESGLKDKKGQPLVMEKDPIKRNEQITSLVLNELVDKFGPSTSKVFAWLGAGGIIPRKGATVVGGTQDAKKYGQHVLEQIAAHPKFTKLDSEGNVIETGIDSEIYAKVEQGLKDGSLLDIPTLNERVGQEIIDRDILETRIKDYENKINPLTEEKYTREEAEFAVTEEGRKMDLALKTQTAGRIERNKKEYQDIQEGKDLIFEKFREIYKQSPEKLPALLDMIYSGNANNHPFRGFATVMGLEKGLKKEDQGREEHFFQFGNFAEAFGKAIGKSDKVWSGFKDWAKEHYWQTKISKDQMDILDQKATDIKFRTLEKIDTYSPKEGMHPAFEKAFNEALETGDFSKVPDVRLRAYNEYFTANPNKLGREYQKEDGTWEYRTDAEDFNVAVPEKYKDNDIIINEQGLLIYRVIQSEAGLISKDSPEYTTRETAREQMNAFEKLITDQEQVVTKIKEKGSGFNLPHAKALDVTTTEEGIHIAQTLDNAVKEGNNIDIETGKKEKKSATVADGDGTTFNDKSIIRVKLPNGLKLELNPAEFAERSKELEDQNAEFDFNDFENLNNPKTAAWWKRFSEQYDQHGPDNMFILSARPQEFAPAMQAWLKSMGKEIPLENITGLGNGTPGAKANWFIKKGAEGYNDFLFADDILANSKAVQGVLNQLQLGGPVQAKLSSKPKVFNDIFNKNLELFTKEKGKMIGADWQFSAARAKSMGEKKNLNPFKNFVFGYSAEDFNGLLYATLPKGKAGDKMKDFYQTNLIDPFNAAERKIESAKIAASNDFKAVKKKLTNLPKSMHTETGIGGFSFGDAARVAIWSQQGVDIPGLSKRDQKKLNKFVSENGDLNVFVNEVIKMQKGKEYPKPGEDWLAGTMTTDIIGEINKVNRKEYLAEWKQNHSIIFSIDNKNKLRAALGNEYVDNLERTLARMESGSNRPLGQNKTTGDILDWVNGSVGATMFLNTRSAALQTISSVNYLNWGDNNIVAAGKAFANQKQYWKDFKTLFNSDYLVNRREGLNINVSESEIADASKKGGAKGAIAYLLNQGFVMTRGADSFAIASGGATFYRNRINKYKKEGWDQKAAEEQAFLDFRKISEENQQSSSPLRISEQQASAAGRVILAFANTPMQYARIIKRSSQDLVAGRGDWKTNISKIVYYGAAQNLIFNGLQNALFADAFDEDGESSDSLGRTANGMADSLLKGLGVQGAAAVAIKNSLITIARESGKESPEFKKAINDLFDFSPPLDAKLRRAQSAANTFSWERERMKNEKFNLNNPAYLASGQVISAAFNIPLDRAFQKINNLRAITSNSSENWQKVALALGWSTWDVGLPYYGVEDRVEETPEMVMKNRIVDMKKATNSKEQKQTLLELGLSRKELKKLKYEEDRIKMIIKLQDEKDKKNKKLGL